MQYRFGNFTSRWWTTVFHVPIDDRERQLTLLMCSIYNQQAHVEFNETDFLQKRYQADRHDAAPSSHNSNFKPLDTTRTRMGGTLGPASPLARNLTNVAAAVVERQFLKVLPCTRL